MNKRTRIMAFVLALLLGFSVLGTLGISLIGYAADDNMTITSVIIKRGTSTAETDTLRTGVQYTVEVYFESDDADIPEGKYTNLGYGALNLTGGLYARAGDKRVLEVQQVTSDGVTYFKATFSNAEYRGNKDDLIKVTANISEGDNSYKGTGTTDIPEGYTSGSGSSGGNSGGNTNGSYSSDIVIENVILRDKEGNQINGPVTEETPAFTVDIIYSDMGMVDVDTDDLEDGTMQAYITDAGGFVPGTSTRGSLTTMLTSTYYPRFRARFTNITYDGGSNSIGFRVQYDIDGLLVSGTSTATVYQAQPEEDEEEEEEIDPITPYIIVSQFSFGDEQIEAGNRFSLNITYRNTSREIPLENIIITVAPSAKGLVIASASNTFFVESLGAGESRSATIELEAIPDAEVGSHPVDLKFTYQYLSNKKRVNGETAESIVIPITQIDRFEAEPITETSDYIEVNNEGYATVNITNKGRSTTYNISAKVSGNLEMITPSENFGNLEAGKSDTFDVTFIPQEFGELYGEVTITYEDEKTNQKEIVLPFTSYVAEPYVPDYGDEMLDPDQGMEESEKSTSLTIVLCSLGGLFLAVPLACIIFKKVRAKGSEEFDEAF